MRWKSFLPSEHQEQKAVIQWTEAVHATLSEASLIFAIPNGGKRPRVKLFKNGGIVQFSPEGMRLRAEGVKEGIPDLFLPVARQEFKGLFIEMKSAKGEARLEQQMWKGRLTAQGYAVCFCRGADAAIKVITGYLTDKAWSPNRAARAFERQP